MTRKKGKYRKNAPGPGNNSPNSASESGESEIEGTEDFPGDSPASAPPANTNDQHVVRRYFSAPVVQDVSSARSRPLLRSSVPGPGSARRSPGDFLTEPAPRLQRPWRGLMIPSKERTGPGSRLRSSTRFRSLLVLLRRTIDMRTQALLLGPRPLPQPKEQPLRDGAPPRLRQHNPNR